MLSVRNLSVGINRTVLSDLNFDVAPGELLTIVGPSGAGKSTLLFTLCGELAPRAGTVTLLDRPLAQWKSAERARRVAVLPQDSSVAFDFSALDVVLLGRTTTATHDSRTEKARANDALERLGIGGLAPRSFRSLSGGEKQRVQLARVMNQLDASQPGRLLLLDEPTASLDVAAAHACMEALLSFARSGASVVLNAHDLTLSSQYADRVLVVSQGGQKSLGRPADTLSKSVLSNAFACDVSVMAMEHNERPVVLASPSETARRLMAKRA